MKYDATIIGSGQGGNPLVHRVADLGWTVALVGQSYLGGTCINTSCTPTKTMVASAQVAHYARNAARWGVETGEVRVDLPAIGSARKNSAEQKLGASESPAPGSIVLVGLCAADTL